MKKIIIATLLVASTLFSSCNGATSDVLIMFSGLMVFSEKELEKDKYELGILRSKDDHNFTVSVDGTDVLNEDLLPYLLPGTKWTLEIPESGPPSTVGKEPIKQRRPDNETRQYDFGWTIDIEDFHPDGVTLQPGYLNPIIQLPAGQISTKYKSYDLIRWQGGDPTTPNHTAYNFGFVPETIGLAVKLRTDQELILKDEGKNEVKLIHKGSPRPFHIVVIKNVPKKYSENSDFHHYYKVFKPVTKPGEQESDVYYHFKANKTKDRYHPNNRFPGYTDQDVSRLPDDDDKKRTCCMMACTVVRTKQALK